MDNSHTNTWPSISYSHNIKLVLHQIIEKFASINSSCYSDKGNVTKILGEVVPHRNPCILNSVRSQSSCKLTCTLTSNEHIIVCRQGILFQLLLNAFEECNHFIIPEYAPFQTWLFSSLSLITPVHIRDVRSGIRRICLSPFHNNPY